jgi:hypothetical protein
MRTVDPSPEVPTPDPGFEIVHFVLGYHDGILDGIADYEGRPHHFELEAWGPPEKSWDSFRLTPLSSDVFRAAEESWDIWCRWERAHRAGEVGSPHGPNPALPGDEDRRRETAQVMAAWLASASATAFVAEAEFKPLLPDAWCGTVRGALQVRWKNATKAADVQRDRPGSR